MAQGVHGAAADADRHAFGVHSGGDVPLRRRAGRSRDRQRGLLKYLSSCPSVLAYVRLRVDELEADLASAENRAATVAEELAAARDELQGCLSDLTGAQS